MILITIKDHINKHLFNVEFNSTKLCSYLVLL